MITLKIMELAVTRALYSTMFFLFSVSIANAATTTLYGFLSIDTGYRESVELSTGEVVDLYQGGSYFALGDNTPNEANAVMLSAGTAGGIELGTFQSFVTNPDIPHPEGWKGDTNGDGVAEGPAGAGYDSLVSEGSAFASFLFFGSPTYIGANSTSYQSGVVKSAPTVEMDFASCNPAPCEFTADFSAWEVYWNGSVFEQGPRPDSSGPFGVASGTVDSVTGQYTLDWSSQIKGGPFSNVTGYWHLEGVFTPNTVAPVPVPAAFWLFSSGMLGLVGLARRKSK